MKTNAITLTLAVVILFSLGFGAQPSPAAVIRVPAEHPTIQAGIDAAAPGDTVLVADGTWTGDGNRDLDFGGRAITLISENGPAACIIHSQGSDADRHRALRFLSGEGRDAVVEGFGITGGFVLNGGAILCDGASPTIRGNVIEDNLALEDGGGICCLGGAAPLIEANTFHDNVADGLETGDGGGVVCVASSPEVLGNTFERNGAWFGGGLYTIDASPTISGNLFIDNGSGHSGGAIGCAGSGAPQISGNQVYANHAYRGGGIWCDGPAAQICNNLIFYNIAQTDGGAIHCSAPVVISFCTIDQNIADSNGGGVYGSGVVHHTIFTSNYWESVHGTFDITWCCGSGYPGQGNFSADPLYVTGPAGAYYLSQIAAGQAADSPCVDAGNPVAPVIEGTSRTDGVGDRWVADVGYHYPLSGSGWKSVGAYMACTPSSGTLPFTSRMEVTISSNYKDQIRTVAGRIDLFLAGGQHFSNWRAGYLNLQPEETWSTSWVQVFPAVGTLVGETVFALHCADVTASPYNQPPYPPSGDTDSAHCTVTASFN